MESILPLRHSEIDQVMSCKCVKVLRWLACEMEIVVEEERQDVVIKFVLDGFELQEERLAYFLDVCYFHCLSHL